MLVRLNKLGNLLNIENLNTMKIKLKFSVLLFLAYILFFASCGGGSGITFSEPQPVGEKNLLKMPEHLQGEFLNPKDSTTLVINNNLIIRNFQLELELLKNKLDSTFRLSGDTIINTITGEKNTFRQIGDTLLLVSSNIKDTLFNLKSGNVLIKYMGCYFLNKKEEENAWNVRKIKLSGDLLEISGVFGEKSKNALEKITGTQFDSLTPINVSLTKKQFKNFVNSDGFENEDSFVRLK
jgi:hypothetical protein